MLSESPTPDYVTEIIARLRAAHPDAHCALDYETPLQLLAAVILSAQCTDERVNLTTPALFARYPTAEALAAADPGELEAIVRPTGFYRNKARFLREAAARLLAEYNGEVPPEMDALLSLPGVARKTANVVRGEVYGLADGITVDTHVKRLAARLGLTTETDPVKRQGLVKSSWQEKRNKMKLVCSSCHTPDYVENFYKQYDDLVILYNEKFAKPGLSIIKALQANNLITKTEFDEEVEWAWYYLWHHEGRRARHGAAMMAPDDTHWHGMFEVAERFYQELIPKAREVAHKADLAGTKTEAAAVNQSIDDIMARPEHAWNKTGAADAEAIQKAMEERYGKQDTTPGTPPRN